VSTVRDTDRGAKALVARLRALRVSSAAVRVGILSDQPKRQRDGGGGGKEPYSLVEVAAVHEFGAPAAGIPRRSFIRATIDEKRAEVERLERALLAQVVEGKIELRQALDLMGAKVAGWIQTRIADGIAPPNAASTVRRKKSSKPLVDTGQLRSAVTWVVEG
jgi:hypothetical protein